MTTVYLAWNPSGNTTLRRHVEDEPVDLLVSSIVLDEFIRDREGFNLRSWCMDSGAFTAQNAGKPITNQEFLAKARDCDADEIFGLDVIYEPEATRRNLEEAWATGVPAIPTVHLGASEADVLWATQNSPVQKIAIGGVARVGKTRRLQFVSEVFARVWPFKVHGFGIAAWDLLRAFPWHSTDSASWVFGPLRLGHYAGYTGAFMKIPGLRGGGRDLWQEVEEYQRRAKWAKWRWRNELALVEGDGDAATA